MKEKRTWADITRGNPSISLPSSTTPSVDRNIYYRLSKEQGEEASRLTPSQLIQRIQEEGNGWQAAIAVKTTKESILLTFSSLAAKQLLVGKQLPIFNSAKAIPNRVAILVHGVKK